MLALLQTVAIWAGIFRGRVVDAQTGEVLIGATLQLLQTRQTAVSNADGTFSFDHLSARNYTLTATYLGYKQRSLTINPAKCDTVLVIALSENESQLGVAIVTAQAKRNTETAQVAAQRQSLLVQNGVSSQQIAKTQDKDASEVIKRVPGISIIDQKFVMVRGLSQRYNNVWINGAAVPSSEPDSRAFSFDIIPSSQVDNMQIIKSPAPQYPADFSGGFILIDTKDVPNTNGARITLGGNINQQSHFRSFFASKGSGTDFLGFDNGFRSLKGGLNAGLQPTTGGKGIDLLANSLNNDWTVKKRKSYADINLSADLNRSKDYDNGAVLALLASMSGKTYSTNSLPIVTLRARATTHRATNCVRPNTTIRAELPTTPSLLASMYGTVVGLTGTQVMPMPTAICPTADAIVLTTN